MGASTEPPGVHPLPGLQSGLHVYGGYLRRCPHPLLGEDERRHKPRAVHHPPVALPRGLQQGIVHRDEPHARVGTYKAVALSRMALPCRDRASVAPLGVGALRVQEAADGGLLLVLDGAVG